ncbi:glutamate-5-semialdehyde dehydrogenase [Hufsiella ginkgonis]|uniref:Gamma-glutamyl phosphate reductase n=1 Tax=Hufsiella ginkgonis TaxID=2695274 RepID=A0A7K1XX48_9SPHI|nr:glutamate-5-semialdehyde dehydrogenase [Hufsiella ginkgonis]MXV15560.1 glutamate-5-semialdehyde dehydrogenase [Hufsiella ginkgonis]
MITTTIQQILEDARSASSEVKKLSDADKQRVLRRLADGILGNAASIMAANREDLAKMDDTDPKKDRLLLTGQRIGDLAASVREVAGLADPANQVLLERTNSNGLHILKKTVPLGVVGVIYESRPNVTVDVAALCLRSGNACLLRGGSDAFATNTVLVNLVRSALEESGMNKNAVQLLPPGRELILEMLGAVRYVDIIIPRGSQQLIEYVREHSRVPVIETGAGVCHTYVESSARLEDAVIVVVNAKVSRPSVCNALDTVLVDRNIAEKFLTLLAPALLPWHVDIFADEAALPLLKETGYPHLFAASPEDFGREFLDYKCSVKVVENSREAIAHIAKYSSRHSEAILTQDARLGDDFLEEVDAAAVYVNASTRFTDGSVFGLGAEIGISTQKLHARGPFALEKLVTEKWVVRGAGQTR